MYTELENVWVRSDRTDEFSYADGGEENLFSIISKAKDLSSGSSELAAAIKDWSTRYHLSPSRSSILRPFQDKLDCRILEVGAGCGPITRYLGEIGGSVTALEPSFSRARTAAKRCLELKNVQVVCDTIGNYQCAEKFDVITLIGVLEYATAYSEFASAAEMLRSCKKLLSPSGIVIIGIENQLGFKYLAGEPEDHLGAQYVGTNDVYPVPGVRTYTLSALQTSLQEAGLSSCSTLLPLPDYKFPLAVIYPEMAETSSLRKELASFTHPLLSKDPQLHTSWHTFSLERAWNLLVENGNILDLANSHLILASNSAETTRSFLGEENLLIKMYSTDVRREFRKETVFRRSNADKIRIERRLLDESAERSSIVRHELRNEDFIKGKLWSEELLRILNTPDWNIDLVTDWTRVWLNELKQFSESPAELNLSTLLSPSALDAVPFNLVRSEEGKLYFFDLEWCWDRPIELGWVLFRGILNTLTRISSVAAPAIDTPLSIMDIIREIFNRIGMELKKEALQHYLGLERQFISAVSLQFQNESFEEIENFRLQVRTSVSKLNEQRETEQIERLRSLSLMLGCEVNSKSCSELFEDIRLQYHVIKETSERYAREADALRAQLTDAQATINQLQTSKEKPDIANEINKSAFSSKVLHTLKPVTRKIEEKVPLRKGRRRLLQSRKILEKSNLFDVKYYLKTYPDILHAGIDPISHYLLKGAAEGRRPHPLFDSEYYLERNCDVAKAGLNPFIHFIEYGAAEGRSPCALFDTLYYLDSFEGEVPTLNPLKHFTEYGWREGRNPHPLFDVNFYLSTYPDVREMAVNPLSHYIEYGAAEGRRTSRDFDSDFYRRQYPDILGSPLSPLEHYIRFGQFEGRRRISKEHEVQSLSEKRLAEAITVGLNSIKKNRVDSLSELSSKDSSSAIETRPRGLSVVIPSYNRKNTLKETLECCRKIQGNTAVEYIIIDDGSSDGTAELLDELTRSYSNITWRSVPNNGPGVARNIGANLAKYPVILFLGDDIQPISDEFFETHLRLHERCRSKQFAVLGKVIWPWLPSDKFTFVMGHIQGHGGEQFGFSDFIPYKFLDWRFFYTCNISVKKDVVANWETGGFSSEFPFAAFEDCEFAYRMAKHYDGFFIYYDPSSLGVHRHSYEAEGFIERQQRAGMMAATFLKLHPDSAEGLGILPIVNILRSHTTPESETSNADFSVIAEGAKAFLRTVSRTSLLGTQSWHGALLSATFELAFLRGFIMNWNEPGANFGAAHQYAVHRYLERMRGELQVTFGEVAIGALSTILSGKEPVIVMN